MQAAIDELLCREKVIPKLLLSREEVHFCEVSRRRAALVSLLAHHSLLLVHAGPYCEFRARKTLPPKRWQGKFQPVVVISPRRSPRTLARSAFPRRSRYPSPYSCEGRYRCRKRRQPQLLAH
jgi:hypothetical protein